MGRLGQVSVTLSPPCYLTQSRFFKGPKKDVKIGVGPSKHMKKWERICSDEYDGTLGAGVSHTKLPCYLTQSRSFLAPPHCDHCPGLKTMCDINL